MIPVLDPDPKLDFQLIVITRKIYNTSNYYLHCKGHYIYHLQSWAAYHLLGFEDEDLGSSPGRWAATVANYCPSRSWELHQLLSSKPSE